MNGFRIGDLLCVTNIRRYELCIGDRLEVRKVVNDSTYPLSGFCLAEHLELLAEPGKWNRKLGVCWRSVEVMENTIYGTHSTELPERRMERI